MEYIVTLTQNVWVKAKNRAEAEIKAWELFNKDSDEVKEELTIEEH